MSRNVIVTSYAVQMTIYEGEDRPEIIPLLEAVEEANQTGRVLVEYISEKLFMDLPQTFVRNVIEELRLLGLVKEGELTLRGRETLAKREVMVPQTGPYEIATVDDPLIPQVVIDCKPLKPSLPVDLFKKENEENENNLTEIPAYILNTMDTRIKPFVESAKPIDIERISEVGSKKRRKRNIEFKFVLDRSNAVLRVQYREYTSSLTIPSSTQPDQVIESILKHIDASADLNAYRIPINPEDLEIAELKTFKKDFKIPTVSIPDLGRFQNVQVKDVDIFPANEEMARRWAERLYIEELSEYLTTKRLNASWDNLVRTYEPLHMYFPPCPTLRELEALIPAQSRKFWFIRAPQDLKLEEVVIE